VPGVVPTNPGIFHITHVDNLPSIVAHGCLWSDAQRIAQNLQTTNIGYSHIKQRRLTRVVPVGVGGRLGEYVPFNFCDRSVMLYVVSRGHENYCGGQDAIVHLVSSVQTAVALQKPWAFTDRHADLAYAAYFDSLADLSEVDWSVMPLDYWAGDEETKEKRQAEFLVYESFPWSGVEMIGVKDAVIAARVQALLPSGKPPVAIHPNWYY
jgi:ssDNA thymidine ADP-ribosyltransferase, DarT